MASVKIVLRPASKVTGLHPIAIQIIENRTPKYISTGYKVHSHQFKDGLVVKHPDAVLINTHIEAKRQQLFKQSVIDDIEGNKTITMFAAIKKLLHNYKVKNQAASFNRMYTNSRYLSDAWNGKDKAVDKITKDDVDRYIEFRYEKGNVTNTVKKNLKDLGTVLNFIDYKGINYFSKAAEALKAVPVERHKLLSDEVKKLEDAELLGGEDQARDMWLFSYYTHGMRFESIATIKADDVRGETLIYRMNKGKKIREIAIHPKLRNIINKYINNGTLYLFPVVKKTFDEWSKKDVIGSANTLMRDYLLKAAKKAGIKGKITMHTARHSFAMNAKRNGVKINTLKDALGHSKTSTTEIYLKSLSDDEINSEVNKMYD